MMAVKWNNNFITHVVDASLWQEVLHHQRSHSKTNSKIFPISKRIASIDGETHLELERNPHTNWDENNGFVFDFRMKKKVNTRNELHVTFMAARFGVRIDSRPPVMPNSRTQTHTHLNWQFNCRRFLHLMTTICDLFVARVVHHWRDHQFIAMMKRRFYMRYTHTTDENHNNRSRAAGAMVQEQSMWSTACICVRKMI